MEHHYISLSLKRKKMESKKMRINFFSFLSKRATIWIFSKEKLQFLQKQKCNFCLEPETISRVFNGRLRTGGTFLIFIKTSKFQQKVRGFNFYLFFILHKRYHYQRASNVTLLTSLNKNV